MSLPQTSKKRLTQVLGSTSRLSSFDFAFLGSSCLSPFSCSSRNFEAFCHFTACSKKRKRPKRLPPPARPRTKNLVMVPGNTSPATKGPVTTVGSLCQGYRSPGTKPRAGARGGAWPELARAWGQFLLAPTHRSPSWGGAGEMIPARENCTAGAGPLCRGLASRCALASFPGYRRIGVQLVTIRPAVSLLGRMRPFDYYFWGTTTSHASCCISCLSFLSLSLMFVSPPSAGNQAVPSSCLLN